MIINPPVENYVISSPLQGQLVANGEPMVNTKLIRTLKWNGDKEGTKEDVVYTDENGMFSFEIFELDMAMRGLEQFGSAAKIYVNDANEDSNLIWYTPKRFREQFSELGSLPQGLVCDLNFEKIATQQDGAAKSKVLTRCRWENMPEYIEL